MINRSFGKIENGNIKYAPNPLWVGDTMIANPKGEMYLYSGYKPIEYTNHPEFKDGYYFTPKFIEMEDKIIQIYEEHIIISDVNKKEDLVELN